MKSSTPNGSSNETNRPLEHLTGLEALMEWPVKTAAAGWMHHDGTGARYGNENTPFELASITKALFAVCILVAVEEGSIAYEQAAGPEGSTIAHLLSHSSGLPPEAPDTADGSLPTMAAVGSRRIYSNLGFELVGEALAASTGMTAGQYFHEAVVQPLGLRSTELYGSPAHGARSSVRDLLVVAGELMKPTLISTETLLHATSPHLGHLAGVLPGFGRQDPNPWGLGFEIKGSKTPHWTSADNSATTFGHFGAAGTFLWIDPEQALACAVLTDEPFGPWALERWPALSTAVLASANLV